jgi:mono/diheme cytochrome c family protein
VGTLPAVATLFFVLTFVALGLITLAIAMSRGRGGLQGLMHSQSRGGRRFATFAFAIALVALGIVVPAAVIAANKDNNDIPHAGISNLTAAEQHGQELFGRRCSLCHTLKAANAVAQVGPNLDQLQPPYALVLDAINKGRAQGNGQMPPQIYSGTDAQDVARFVAKTAGATG